MVDPQWMKAEGERGSAKMKEIIGAVVLLGLLTWILVDFSTFQTVVVVLFSRFAELVQSFSNWAGSMVSGS